MRAPDGVEFCVGCPNVPDGVTARVDMVSQTDIAEYQRLRIAHELPRFVAKFVRASLTIHTTAIASTSPFVSVGDTGQIIIKQDDQTEQQIIDAVQDCQRPKRGLLATILGQKGTCPAVKAKYLDRSNF